VITRIVEAGQGKNMPANWGKFMVMWPDEQEWSHHSEMDPKGPMPLLRKIGWSRQHIWVLDLQTGEGGCFLHGGVAGADLRKHRIWVCPLFEPFLAWLYLQPLSELASLPALVELPKAEFALFGYRREGK
jgi:hypothetical protein